MGALVFGWRRQRVGLGLGMILRVVLAGGLVGLGGVGCGLIGIFSEDCRGPEPAAPGEALSPIAMALRYLAFTQVKVDDLSGNVVEYAGNWPQCYGADPRGPFVRDVNPYGPAFIHHALCLVTAQNRQALGLTAGDVKAARQMRRRAVEFMLRFRVDDGHPDAGAFGYYPPGPPRWHLGDDLLAALFEQRYKGPAFHGFLYPANMSFFPRSFAIPADADTTAAVYASLLDNAVVDGGPEVSVAFERFFSDWRDLGQVPQRNQQPWIPKNSGAFLTWLAYRDDPAKPNINDMDILVNANILYALGRYGRLETPGVAEAIGLINGAILSGVHLSNPDALSIYYSDDIVLHHYVIRAWNEGGVAGLEPAVAPLVDDLLGTVQRDDAGRCYWDRGHPHLNTALGALALMGADRAWDVVGSAIDYLIAEQDPVTGAWDPGMLFVGSLDDGTKPVWLSTAYTTALALEALCRYRLWVGGP
jgi:hypothetical protein